jgi:hypothetical protein
MRDVGRYVVAASPDFDVVAALPAFVECTADFCRSCFARVFLCGRCARVNLSFQPMQLVHFLGCLGYSLYGHAILHGHRGWLVKPGAQVFKSNFHQQKDAFLDAVFRTRFGMRLGDMFSAIRYP